ncbi:MAG TPA: hypothetical protein VGB26_11370 [Nitrospiria bacterium]|jgi:hypothetical protein
MITNFEVSVFLKDLRDEGPEVKGIVENFLKVVDDAHNPDLDKARKRLQALMKRDLEIGKNKEVWDLFANRLEGIPPETSDPLSPRKKVDLGLSPP